ncbi:hypothetical protein GCM10027046_33350 [Uliginosibacterium flavum]|uniref:histidine kinase n=1 Tax=Uliginosibacterium flavum TaxID=1396831 RepID=A0ABV2TPU0_9RHOO
MLGHNAGLPVKDLIVPLLNPAADLEVPASDQITHLVETDIHLLSIVLWLFLGIGLPLSLAANIFSSANLLSRVIMPSGILCLSLIALWLLRRQKINATLNVFLWGMTALVCAQCVLVNGIRTPMAAALPVIVILSAWTRGARHSSILCCAIIFALSAMAVLDDRLWPELLPRSAFQYWVIYSFCMVLGAVVAGRLAAAMRSHAARQTQTADELAQRVRELQLAQDKFATFFYLNPVPVSITLLADGTYYDVNPAWEKLAGWNKDELLGKTSTQIGIWVTQAERDAWIEEFRRQSSSSNQPVRFRLRNGDIRYFQASCETINYDGHPCIFAAFVDVTARREAEDALKQLNARLEERVSERTQRLAEANLSLANTVDILQRTQDELVHSETMVSLGSMVAGISHELNTPIGNALTVASSLYEQAREMARNFDGSNITRSALKSFIDEQQHGAELASVSLRRAGELVASFKQVAVDQASERRRRFDLAETMTGVLDTLRPMLRFKPIELLSELPAGIMMDSYPGPLGQIVSNLVQNALLHGLDDTRTGKVWIKARQIDESVQIVVSDDGRGISDENLGRIFDPFFTTRLGQGGSGLGLSIVYRLVSTVLGGSIAVDSTPGQGTSFTLSLPLTAPVGPAGAA